METVICRQCKYFRQSDPPTSYKELGQCQHMIEWYAKYKQRGIKPSVSAQNQSYKACGDKLCWPDVERYCQKYSK